LSPADFQKIPLRIDQNTPFQAKNSFLLGTGLVPSQADPSSAPQPSRLHPSYRTAARFTHVTVCMSGPDEPTPHHTKQQQQQENNGNKDSKQTSVSIRITISQLYMLHGHRRSITRYTPVHGISIGSAVFAGLTVVTDRQTDRPRYSVCSNRPHLRIVLRCGLVTTTLSVVNLGVSVTAWYERDEVDHVACAPRTDAVQVGSGTQHRTRRLNAA